MGGGCDVDWGLAEFTAAGLVEEIVGNNAMELEGI